MRTETLVILSSGLSATRPASSVIGSVGTAQRVCFIERVAVLAVRLCRIALELDVRRAVQIVCVGFHNEVARIATRGIHACMAGLHSLRNGDSFQVENKPMGEPSSCAARIATSCAEMTVPRRQSVTEPGPTFLRPALLNLGLAA